jgi:uncharacterized phage-associated protein
VGLMPYSSLEIGNEFLRLADGHRAKLTQMQLQKLVYLAHGYFLAATGRPLVEDDVEAWDYGSVFPKLRNATKEYGKRAISRPIRWGDELLFPPRNSKAAVADLRDQDQRIIGKVWSVYGRFPAFKLSALTHDPNGPWAKAYVEGENRVIPDDDILQYFRDLRVRNARQRPA